MKVVAVAVLISAVLAVSAAVPASDLPPALRKLLSKELKFTPSELAELEIGKVVAHRLGATAPGEVGAAGAIRVKGRKEAFVDLYRDIVNFKRDPDVVGSSPAFRFRSIENPQARNPAPTSANCTGSSSAR